MHFDISITELLYFPCENTHPNKDTAPVIIAPYTICNNEEQIWVGIWLTNNLRPKTHIVKLAAAASIRRYKLIPLLKRLRPELASRLVKATVIHTMTFGLEASAELTSMKTRSLPSKSAYERQPMSSHMAGKSRPLCLLYRSWAPHTTKPHKADCNPSKRQVDRPSQRPPSPLKSSMG